MKEAIATGCVIKAFGNLLHVRFEGNIKQGEVAYLKLNELSIPAEVIEINGDMAKLQVFEDTSGVKLNTSVEFTKNLLEAELGPGLLTSIFDGLQNPLEGIAKKTGLFLNRGIKISPLDMEKKWDFKPLAQINDTIEPLDALGFVKELSFDHKIFIPFSMKGKYTLSWIAKEGSYNIETTIAKIKDEKGVEYPVNMIQRWPVKKPLSIGRKVLPQKMMSTGLRILDTGFPVLKGGTFCSPGPFGAGKTVLQHHLSKFSDVDIVVVTACGERAGEVVELLKEFPTIIDEKTKKPLINRTVIICNTSSMPVAAREASVYMGVTIAEYYRQMGLDVLVLADSTSRWAQAMREISGRLEEIPGEEAFPAYLSSRIASFYERAGVLELKDSKTGSLTIGGSVSPAGGNFEEPVTQATLAVVGAFLGLSRERSDARRYPAIDPLISWTKYLHIVSNQLSSAVDNWEGRVNTAFSFIKNASDISKRMEVVGEEGISIDDMIVYLKGELYDICYLQQNAFDLEDGYCSLERQIELFNLMSEIFANKFTFESHDMARDFFLSLQNEIKNINFITYKSQSYQDSIAGVLTKINNFEQVQV
jgi:V/A-type H+/Na+-transporting ATPase subunit A